MAWMLDWKLDADWKMNMENSNRMELWHFSRASNEHGICHNDGYLMLMPNAEVRSQLLTAELHMILHQVTLLNTALFIEIIIREIFDAILEKLSFSDDFPIYQ